MEKRLEKAISEYRHAQEERRTAEAVYKEKQKATAAIIDSITAGDGKSRIQALHEAREAIETASEAEAAAKQEWKFAEAVTLSAGQNVANIAVNVFLDAVQAEPKKFAAPVHYKKWKAAFSEILPTDMFYAEAVYNDWINIHFLPAEYNHRAAWACGIGKDGKVEIKPERDKRHPEVTLEEIKAETRQAMQEHAGRLINRMSSI